MFRYIFGVPILCLGLAICISIFFSGSVSGCFGGCHSVKELLPLIPGTGISIVGIFILSGPPYFPIE